MLCARCLSIFQTDFQSDDELGSPHWLDLTETPHDSSCPLCLLLLERFPLVDEAQSSQATNPRGEPLSNKVPSGTIPPNSGPYSYTNDGSELGDSDDSISCYGVAAAVDKTGLDRDCADTGQNKEIRKEKHSQPHLAGGKRRRSRDDPNYSKNATTAFSKRRSEARKEKLEVRLQNRLNFWLVQDYVIDVNAFYLHFESIGTPKRHLRLSLVPFKGMHLKPWLAIRKEIANTAVKRFL